MPTDDATTTGVDEAIGQGVDLTCDDLVSFFSLSKDADIAHGGNSIDDLEELAAAASELGQGA